MVPPDAGPYSAQAGADISTVTLPRASNSGDRSMMTIAARWHLIAAYVAVAFVCAIVFGLL